MMTDVPPHKRIYYRNTQTGDRGYVIERGGKRIVKYDLPMMDRTEPLTSKWQPDDEHRPLNRNQLAQIAYTADQKLCFFLGRRQNKDWIDLRDAERIAFMNDGPAEGGSRMRLFLGIMAAIEELAS